MEDGLGAVKALMQTRDLLGFRPRGFGGIESEEVSIEHSGTARILNSQFSLSYPG